MIKWDRAKGRYLVRLDCEGADQSAKLVALKPKALQEFREPGILHSAAPPTLPGLVLWTDPQFPPTKASVGDLGDHRGNGIRWARASTLGLHELYSAQHGDTNMIDATDIKQGCLGDCWLLSSLACLAKFPGAIEELFVSKGERHQWLDNF